MQNIYNNILLIFGSGRRVGKTAFVRTIISNSEKNITALKISHHFHNPTTGLIKLSEGNGWVINRDENTTSKKDSSLFLQAGAKQSFYIQVEKNCIQDMFYRLKDMLPEKEPVIIESAGLSELIRPGLSIYIYKKDIETNKNQLKTKNADLEVFSNGKRFFPDPEFIIFDKVWQIKT